MCFKKGVLAIEPKNMEETYEFLILVENKLLANSAPPHKRRFPLHKGGFLQGIPFLLLQHKHQ